jgi:hypothetical protein
MSYTRVSEIVRQCVEDLVAVGVAREVAERHIRPLECAAVESIAENQRNQILLDFSIRTADLAECFGVDDRTIRKWRKSALKRNARAVTCSEKFA